MVVALLVAFALTGLAYYAISNNHVVTPQGGPNLLHATCSSVNNSGNIVHTASGGSGDNASFLIVESDPPGPYAGMNGSYYVPTNETWPTMHVRLGQTVSIHVINCAASEAHGFQIQFYDDRSTVSVQPGQSYDVTFVATRAGNFRVYCNIFCAIHVFMQNGELVVT